MNRNELIADLRQYVAFNEKEEAMREKLLAFVKEYENCFDRSLLIGHVTASCWVVNKSRTKVLLIHHAKLNKWLQPGGHCDGDENTYQVAEKELLEETGLVALKKDTTIFDVDVHTIPERKSVPEHKHYDIRYLFEVDENAPLIKNHETLGMKWLVMNDVPNLTSEESILRMKNKLELSPS
ncbi:NUDIX hydrolase [Arcticibacterium luteifluviistationis]|uniref:NUDIX hydrolase n=1 Tax=Arcticibacterium luteifluviistationis TaxID=1784714 RepID=A0A2Z4GBA4_9BACT|nr:NUDIX hydrolase [Arcticibacterium luteifluviistationis]AWV98414.1 NUDIX hydrolase [Arcticibacterium luteifluviistationis]